MSGEQGRTGDTTEGRVLERLRALGLQARKPVPDVGVDLEVWSPEDPEFKLALQVKGRGSKQSNKRYRWFQIRTTPKQRADTIGAGLPVTDAWKKKVSLCAFFVLVSLKHDEFWVFPPDVVHQIVLHNRAKYGRRKDNLSGAHAEMDLDIVVDGAPLTETYSRYRDNFAPLLERLNLSTPAPEVR